MVECALRPVIPTYGAELRFVMLFHPLGFGVAHLNAPSSRIHLTTSRLINHLLEEAYCWHKLRPLEPLGDRGKISAVMLGQQLSHQKGGIWHIFTPDLLLHIP